MARREEGMGRQKGRGKGILTPNVKDAPPRLKISSPT